MECKLYNTGTEAVTVLYADKTVLLNPCEDVVLNTGSDKFCIKLQHTKGYGYHGLWYVLNEIFTLEQMCTALIVDGEYVITPQKQEMLIHFKDYEYVFEKNTSYRTFVFHAQGAKLERERLSVVQGERILSQAKFLYLFGGKKTLLPLSVVLFFACCSNLLFASDAYAWMWLPAILSLLLFAVSFANYLRSLKSLKKAIYEDNILRYMASERKEHRTSQDDLVRKYMDENAGTETYT